MSERPKAAPKSAAYQIDVIDGWKTVSVGRVKVVVRVPTKNEFKERITESKAVAVRLTKAIARPGVKLQVKATTPMYSVDDLDPTLVIQKKGDKAVRGRFNDLGAFVKVR